MRRLFVLAAACAVALLVFAGAACAEPSRSIHRSAGPAELSPALHARQVRLSPRSFLRPQFVPAPQALASAAAIDGTIKDYYGFAMSYATVGWAVGTAGSGAGTADDTGHYAFTNVPAAAADGAITAVSNDESVMYGRWNLSWLSPGPTTFDMWPGAVTIQGTTGGPWGQYAQRMLTDIYTSSGSEVSETSKVLESSFSSSVPALPGTIEGIGVYFFDDEGVEVTALNGQAITSGTTLGSVATACEADAQRVWTGGPAWNGPRASGKPASTFKLWLQNFPSGWVNSISGRSSDPNESAAHDYGTMPSRGETKHYRALKVPATAVPGYAYAIRINHTTGPLELGAWFQVCTFKASKARLHKGGTFRMRGIVPVEGHDGATAGTATTVYIFAHRGTARQPTSFKPRRLKKQGWEYVGPVTTDGYGAFRTPLLKPKVTLTLVGLYPGDNWYYPAFTSPAKITVR